MVASVKKVKKRITISKGSADAVMLHINGCVLRSNQLDPRSGILFCRIIYLYNNKLGVVWLEH